MVAGAALLGLLLAGLPLLSLTGGSGEADGDIGDGADDPPEDADPSGDAGAPVDYAFVFRAGDEAVAGFRPGIDTLTITSDTWDIGLTAFEDGGGAVLEVARGDETAILRFPGLSALPFGDIFLNVEEPGEPPVTLPIADAAEPLLPTPPDAPEDAPQPPAAGPPVVPSDPDAPDLPPGASDAPSVPLAPTDPDAPEA